jgi:hypothetical protein
VDERSTLLEGPAQVSPHIADMIRRRVAASGHSFSGVPTPGQILSIERVVGPDGDLGWDLARPLAVLIESHSVRENGSEFRDVWYGWMVAPETDYATWWDFVLGAEDEPFDPLAGVVQVWNPVYVYLKSTNPNRILAELRPARLQAVRALAEEYLTAAEPDPDEARPGFVALRETLGGLPVLTGTPLSGPDDPRWRYQELYHEAAEAIRLPARLAQRAATDPLGALLKHLFAAAQGAVEAAQKLLPEIRDLTPVFAPARLGEEAEAVPQAYRIGDLLEFRQTTVNEGLRQLHVRLLGERKLRVVLLKDGEEEAWHLLAPDMREASLWLEAGHDYAWRVTDVEGGVQYVPPEV